MSLKPSGFSSSGDEKLISKKLKGVHLVVKNDEKIDTKQFEEETKDTEKDCKEADNESDLYEKLVEAINNGNGELQDEMMDKIVEEFDNADNINKEDNREGLKGNKAVTKRVRRKAVVGMRAKGRGRGR